MSKQTAVEWLMNEIDMQFPSINIRHKEWILDQAKAMEREQRFKDFQGGFQAATDAIIAANKSVQSKTYGKEAGHESI